MCEGLQDPSASGLPLSDVPAFLPHVCVPGTRSGTATGQEARQAGMVSALTVAIVLGGEAAMTQILPQMWKK